MQGSVGTRPAGWDLAWPTLVAGLYMPSSDWTSVSSLGVQKLNFLELEVP